MTDDSTNKRKVHGEQFQKEKYKVKLRYAYVVKRELPERNTKPFSAKLA